MNEKILKQAERVCVRDKIQFSQSERWIFSYRIFTRFIHFIFVSFFNLPLDVYWMFFSYRSYVAEAMREKELMLT